MITIPNKNGFPTDGEAREQADGERDKSHKHASRGVEHGLPDFTDNEVDDFIDDFKEDELPGDEV